MLDSEGFNMWANLYDSTVNISEENNKYPFAGYKDVLNYIYEQVCKKENADVLDIGFGTAILTTQLYNKGYNITGYDFLTKMIEIGKMKMPNALLVKGDFSTEIPTAINTLKYDYIICTYAIHHLTGCEKIKLIDKIVPLLKSCGKILIGDISFETRKDHESCKNDSKQYWDNDEAYFIYSEIKEKLRDKYNCYYKKISHCAGVLVVTLKIQNKI